MTADIRGILINPYDRTVTERFGPFRENKAIYAALSTPEHKVEIFTVIEAFHEYLYLDDEGLLWPDRKLFLIANYHQPLVGCALLLACTASGNNASSLASVEEVERAIDWIDGVTTGDFAPAPEPYQNEAGFTVISSGRPIFAKEPK
jgi:hypothetical protein